MSDCSNLVEGLVNLTYLEDEKLEDIKMLVREAAKFYSDYKDRFAFASTCPDPSKAILYCPKEVFSSIMIELIKRCGMFEETDSVVLNIHMNKDFFTKEAQLPYMGFEEQDNLRYTFRHLFKLDDNMFYTGEPYIDDFIEGLNDGTVKVPSINCFICDMCC